MINISWDHKAAQAPTFAVLLPGALSAIDRWAEPVGRMQSDEYGVFYRVILREGVNAKAPVAEDTSWLLRPATLRLGAMKILQEAPALHLGFSDEIMDTFVNVGLRSQDATFGIHDFHKETLDLMVQLAWFREVWFA